MDRDQFADIQILGEQPHLFTRILSPEAVSFVAHLARTFEPRRRQLAQVRRKGKNTVALTGIATSVERKALIDALNAVTGVCIADFETSTPPTWANMIQGQINLRDAVNGNICFTSLQGKVHALNKTTATLAVRPRGWGAVEAHMLVDGAPVSAALFDFGLFFFHNAETLLVNGDSPRMDLSGVRSPIEAKLWNDVFIEAQRVMGFPCGCIKASIDAEGPKAEFKMDEILLELHEHAAGLKRAVVVH